MIDIKQLAAYMSKPENFQFVAAAVNADDKKRRIEQLKAKFMQSNFSAVANFSADISDFGSPDGVYDSDWDFATFNKHAKEVTAFQRIKTIVANSNVRESVKQWALQKNAITKRNRERKAEAQKAFANR